MQNSTKSNNSQNPAPTDITPSVSRMSEECDDDDVWTCNDTLRYLGDRSIKATDTMRSAKLAHVEAVKNSMSMHRDEDGNSDRSTGTAQGNHTGQAFNEAIQRSLTASARFMSHHAEHPHGALSSLVSRSPSSLERI